MILIANVGSSSLKVTAYLEKAVEFIAHAEWATPEGHARECFISDKTGRIGRLIVPQNSSAELAILDWITDHLKSRFPEEKVYAIGHRIVHGGARFTQPAIVTPEILLALGELISLAPSHQRRSLLIVRTLGQLLPGTPQVVCFDTTFHATMPLYERMLGLPTSYFHRGIRRYGFHGLSYESIALQLGDICVQAYEGRTIVCHLGSGSSVCALRGGRSIATTMSFTSLDGLMMATRAGTIDPGVILYLLRNEHMELEQVEHLLTEESGLLGISGISGDVRELMHSSENSAKEALGLFCYRVVREIGALVCTLQGIDALIFTGGIGENSPYIRETICDQLKWLGVLIDPIANKTTGPILHRNESKVSVLTLPSNESAVILKHTLSLVESISATDDVI